MFTWNLGKCCLKYRLRFLGWQFWDTLNHMFKETFASETPLTIGQISSWQLAAEDNLSSTKLHSAFRVWRDLKNHSERWKVQLQGFHFGPSWTLHGYGWHMYKQWDFWLWGFKKHFTNMSKKHQKTMLISCVSIFKTTHVSWTFLEVFFSCFPRLVKGSHWETIQEQEKSWASKMAVLVSRK